MAVYSSSDSTGVAHSVARYVIDAQKKALQLKSTFTIAVSGGSMGKVLKAGLIDDAEFAPQVQWDKWQVYFSDERLVPLDHADSNYGLFISLVVDHLKGEKPAVHSIDVSLLTGKDGQVEGADESKDEAISEAYSKIIPTNGVFDLVLLGCGPDGHTCSLFPGHSLLQETSKSIALIRDSPKPPPRRISFTLPLLAKAEAIAFIAEGEGKAPVIREIFNDPTSQLPCKLVNDLEVPVAWFVNDAALENTDVIASKY